VSLNQAIKDLNAIFVNAESGFAETVYHIPGGVSDDRVELLGVVDWDAEEGQNNVRGDGRVINQDRGRSTRQSCMIELPSSVLVRETGRDQFEVMDPVTETLVLMGVKRIIGRDAGMQTVLCIRTTEHSAQTARRLG
jgi:hypothetical protein